MSSSADGGPSPRRGEATPRQTSTLRRELFTPRRTREFRSLHADRWLT